MLRPTCFVAVLALVIVLSTGALALAGEPFPDVPPGHWAQEAVSYLADKGLVIGYPDGTFGGDRIFTRYEMAEVFARMVAQLESKGLTAAASEDGLTIPVGHSRVLQVPDVSRVAIANPAIADVVPVSDSEILVLAVATGRTNLVTWVDDTRTERTIEVIPDLVAIDKAIKAAFGAMPIKLLSVGGSVILAGQVPTETYRTNLQLLVEGAGYPVTNLLEVPVNAENRVEVVKGTTVSEISVEKE